MRDLLSKLNRLGFTVALTVMMMEGCTRSPIVVNKSTCTVSWDAVGDPSVKEYRVTIWPNVGEPEPKDVAYPVNATKTKTSCTEAGARAAGSWLVSVRACREKKSGKEDNCSEPAGPVAFTIVDR